MALTPTTVGDNTWGVGISATSYQSDQLIAGRFMLETKDVTIAAGTLQRGTVLGKVTATGNYIASVATAVDGSQNPVAILADGADASGAPVSAPIYQTGEFTGSRLILDASWTLAAVTTALRVAGIYVKSSLSNADPT